MQTWTQHDFSDTVLIPLVLTTGEGCNSDTPKLILTHQSTRILWHLVWWRFLTKFKGRIFMRKWWIMWFYEFLGTEKRRYMVGETRCQKQAESVRQFRWFCFGTCSVELPVQKTFEQRRLKFLIDDVRPPSENETLTANVHHELFFSFDIKLFSHKNTIWYVMCLFTKS